MELRHGDLAAFEPSGEAVEFEARSRDRIRSRLGQLPTSTISCSGICFCPHVARGSTRRRGTHLVDQAAPRSGRPSVSTCPAARLIDRPLRFGAGPLRRHRLVPATQGAGSLQDNDALAALAPGRIWDMATTLGRAALNAEVTKQAAVVAYANDFKHDGDRGADRAAADLPAEARQGTAGRGGDPGVGVSQPDARMPAASWEDRTAATARLSPTGYAPGDHPSPRHG